MDFKGKDDSNRSIIVTSDSGRITNVVGFEHIKNEYICEGSSATDLASKYNLPVETVDKFIQDNQLDKVRAAHIKHGLSQLQNIQLLQAEKLMQIENQFKKMRIIQIEKMLEDYSAYYSKHGHFYKVHPITSEILKDTNGIPLQIKLPNVSFEIGQLKESVSLSEGLKQMLGHIEDIINKPKDAQTVDDPNILDASFKNLFTQKKPGDDD